MSLTFPALNAAGMITQRPYSSQRRYLTTGVDLPNGVRYGEAERSTPLNYFTLVYNQIVAAEVAVLEAFFVACEGRFQTFSFTDPEGIVRPVCRFDSDELKVTYQGYNSYGISIPITEFVP
jgi:hypothetical protein